MGDQGAQSKRAIDRLDPVEPLHVAQAHETPRTNQLLAHHGHEGGAAGDDARVFAVLAEDGEGFIERPRHAILEGVHGRLRWAAARIDSMIL